MRIRAGFGGLALVAIGCSAFAASALGGSAPAGPNVTIQDSFASIDTFQALNATDERSRTKDGNDFIGFSENLHPAVLRGPEGKADTFVSLGTTLETPSSKPFPTGPLNDIAVTGRLRDEATKSSNPAPGVPVASSEGSAEVEFTTSGPTPFLFSGALNAQNSDHDNCTEIDVDLSGPINHTFVARGGGDCSPSGPRHRGFVVSDVLPAGDYQLNVDYSSTVDPEDPRHRDLHRGGRRQHLLLPQVHRARRQPAEHAERHDGGRRDLRPGWKRPDQRPRRSRSHPRRGRQ